MSVSIQINKKMGDFSLHIDFSSQAKRIGILGASGCGKSMTLKCIAGIMEPDQGLICIDDKVLYDSKKKINPIPQKRRVGYLFQNYALFPNMNVRQNIGIGLKVSKREKESIVDSYIKKFHLEGLENHLPSQLSGGQQQRVALARIMAYQPDVILLDEPFSALDVDLKERVQHEILSLLDDYEGTVIMVSHSRDEIYRFSQDLLIIDDGRSICQGDTKEIFKNPGFEPAARLTGCKNIVSAQKKEGHVLYIPDWDISLHIGEDISAINYIGLRAHDFIPIWGREEENCIPVRKYRLDRLPFERKYYIESKGQEICWFIQRDQWNIIEEKGFPDYLQIPKDKILLLQ